jgi:hypothetical protein
MKMPKLLRKKPPRPLGPNQTGIPFAYASLIPSDIAWSLVYSAGVNRVEFLLRYRTEKKVEYAVWQEVIPTELRTMSEFDFKVIYLWPAMRRLEKQSGHKFLPSDLTEK